MELKKDGFAAGALLKEFQCVNPSEESRWFAYLSQLTDREAREVFEKARWPKIKRCLKCRSDSVRRIYGKRSPQGLHYCRKCRCTFTAITGTIFAGFHVSLKKWLLVIYFLCCSTRVESIRDVARVVDVPYPTVLKMAPRIIAHFDT